MAHSTVISLSPSVLFSSTSSSCIFSISQLDFRITVNFVDSMKASDEMNLFWYLFFACVLLGTVIQKPISVFLFAKMSKDADGAYKRTNW